MTGTNDGNCHPEQSEGSFRGRARSFAKEAQDDKKNEMTKKLRMTNDGNCHPERREGSFRGRVRSFAKEAQDDKKSR